MLGSSSATKIGKVVAVLDVGSGSAGAVLMAVDGKGPGRILAAHRATLPYEERNEEAAISGIMSQLGVAVEKVLSVYTTHAHKRVSAIGEVYVIVRAPWTHSKTIHLETKLEKEQRITDEMISEIAQKAVAEVTDIDKNNLLEASVIRVELNGYPTMRPRGRVAKQVGVSALISDCDPRIKSAIEETVTRLFAKKPIYRSGTRAVLGYLREHLGRINYLIIDMASEATSITAVRKDVMAEHVVIPFGVRSLIRRIADKGLPEETLALLRMISENKCESAACKALEESLARAEPELVRILGDAMAEMTTLRRLPNDVILLTLSDLADWLAQFFSKIDFAQFTITTRPFSVENLSFKDLGMFVDVENGVSADTGLRVAASLVNIEKSMGK